MYDHQWSQAITAFATKACELATKSHMSNFCEGFCRDMLWLWSIETKHARKKDFLSSREKRAKPKIKTTFGKSLFLIKFKKQKKNFCPPKKKSKATNKNNHRISERRYLQLDTERAARFTYLWCKRPRNKPCDTCLWKQAQRNEVRASKQLRSAASTETFNGDQA